MIKEVTKPKECEKCKIRIDVCNTTSYRKFCKIKAYSEGVKEKETETQDERVFDLGMI